MELEVAASRVFSEHARIHTEKKKNESTSQYTDIDKFVDILQK